MTHPVVIIILVLKLPVRASIFGNIVPRKYQEVFVSLSLLIVLQGQEESVEQEGRKEWGRRVSGMKSTIH